MNTFGANVNTCAIVKSAAACSSAPCVCQGTECSAKRRFSYSPDPYPDEDLPFSTPAEEEAC